ncbi:MAG TPA: GNAT family N-acetyltransferase [Alkalispirochaeta sp.]|nr:GNAT family N-acetyltransferase [Alkalispirochaeta sp.]
MFEMRDPIVRQVIFAVENQNIRYLMDMNKGQLVRPETVPEGERPERDSEIDPAARYQPLPDWSSADGFQLMEQFVTELHNPIVRDQLQEILVSGKRVFRRFKDAIKEYPDVERKFYSFKFLHMRNVVFEWYNSIRELRGMELLELGADEEIDDLVLTNVTIHEAHPVPATVIHELDRQAFFEALSDHPEPLARYLYEERRSRLPDPGDAHSSVIAAYTPMEELCGFVWSVQDMLDDSSSIATMAQVYVFPEYRGLGIGSTIVDHTITLLRKRGIATILAHFPGSSEPIHALLARAGFHDIRRDLVLNLGG